MIRFDTPGNSQESDSDKRIEGVGDNYRVENGLIMMDGCRVSTKERSLSTEDYHGGSSKIYKMAGEGNREEENR